MSEYTPTVDEVREVFADGRTGIGEWTRFDDSVKRAVEEAHAEYDRMISGVERAAAARALAWAAEHLSDGLRYEDILEINSWEAVTVCAGILRARAAEIREGKSE